MNKIVFASASDDMHQGWIWLADERLSSRNVVKVTNLENKKSFHCEALKIDANFLGRYNQLPRISIKKPSDTIVLSEWYRGLLGGVETQSIVTLKIVRCRTWLGSIRACLDHPQAVVRVAAVMGIIGTVLGVVGLGLSLWQIFSLEIHNFINEVNRLATISSYRVVNYFSY